MNVYPSTTPNLLHHRFSRTTRKIDPIWPTVCTVNATGKARNFMLNKVQFQASRAPPNRKEKLCDRGRTPPPPAESFSACSNYTILALLSSTHVLSHLSSLLTLFVVLSKITPVIQGVPVPAVQPRKRCS